MSSTHGLLTDIPVVGIGLNLHLADNVPDAGHPVSQQGEHGHQQRQDHSAVLRVAVHLLEQSQQTEQTDCFQEVDNGYLGTKEIKWQFRMENVISSKELVS